ncbi:MAG: acetamidase/formamidase family protein [Pseudomonadales bacterium]|nr:acetamidase/formamidase family protein [Pseudomonadales bacterium]
MTVDMLRKLLVLTSLLGIFFADSIATVNAADDALVIRKQGRNCGEDPNCINRLHHELPMTLHARPGQTIVFETRNTTDFPLDPALNTTDPRSAAAPGSTVHPLTGPVYIEGARAGDTLAVSILDVLPGDYGVTLILPLGMLADLFPAQRYQLTWTLGERWATSAALPGIRIPRAGFPGIVTVLPDASLTRGILERERKLAEAGAQVSLPEPANAYPDALCGPAGSKRDECLRTAPPREHGGNFDIRYLGAGATLYLPCRVDGCGLAIGDVHYAQGDGEVSGTAIEMDANVVVRTEIVRDRRLRHGAHYEGDASLLAIPSSRFYATTGFPIKAGGEVPADLRYLESAKIAGLENLSKDIGLAAHNALSEMLDYLVEQKGLTREQAYIVMSVAVDLRIGQVVDAPNVVVSAILPLDIFVAEAP